MTDKEAIGEFFQGLVAVLIVLPVFGAFIIALSQRSSQSTSFEIVDKYKNCNVIRYVNESKRYIYFLHCPPD